VTKICIICNEDCSNEPRFKNEDGHYVCARCHATQQDNDQQQVDETKAPEPRWAVFCGYFGLALWGMALIFVPAACVYMGLGSSWFPYPHTADAWLIAVGFPAACFCMVTVDPRFLSYFIKILLFAPVAIAAGYTDSNMLRGLSLTWMAIIGCYTVFYDFVKDRG